MSRLDLLLLAEESLSFADDEYLSQRLRMARVWPTFDEAERAAATAELGVDDPDLWMRFRSRGNVLRGMPFAAKPRNPCRSKTRESGLLAPRHSVGMTRGRGPPFQQNNRRCKPANGVHDAAHEQSSSR